MVNDTIMNVENVAKLTVLPVIWPDINKPIGNRKLASPNSLILKLMVHFFSNPLDHSMLHSNFKFDIA